MGVKSKILDAKGLGETGKQFTYNNQEMCYR